MFTIIKDIGGKCLGSCPTVFICCIAYKSYNFVLHYQLHRELIGVEAHNLLNHFKRIINYIYNLVDKNITHDVEVTCDAYSILMYSDFL